MSPVVSRIGRFGLPVRDGRVVTANFGKCRVYCLFNRLDRSLKQAQVTLGSENRSPAA